MRVRHCTLRVIVREPWLFEDREALYQELVRLVTDVLAVRLSTKLDRIRQPAWLGTVAMRAVLPAEIVLGPARAGTIGIVGRRLSSFNAEVTVHDAVSDALRAAFEQIDFERLGWQDAIHGPWPIGPDGRRPGPESATGPARYLEALAPSRPEQHLYATSAAVAFRSAERLVAAVGRTLVAAVRLGRLRQLLRRSNPALAAEWIRLLTSAAGWPVPNVATKPGDHSVRLGGRDDGFGQAVTRSLDWHQIAAGAGAGAVRLNGRHTAAPRTGIGRHDDDHDHDWLEHDASARPGTAADAMAWDAGTGAGDEVPVRETPELAASGRPTAAERMAGEARTDAGGERPDSHASEAGASGRPLTAGEVEAAACAVVGALKGQADPASIRLEAAVSLAARLHLLPTDPRVWHALEPLLAPSTASAQNASDAETSAPSAQPSPEPDNRQSSARREVAVASVLPFLLVGPLDDLGVIDAVTAALAGPGWSDLLAAFAAGLARKVLPPPQDGWQQPTEVTAAVAAFAGQEHVPDGAAMERLARSADSWWPVVEEALTAELIEFRAEGSPLVVSRSPGGLVAADADGLAPLQWDGHHDATRLLWERCGRPSVVTDASLAVPLAALSPIDDPAQVEPLADLVTRARERPASGRTDLAPELDGPTSFVAGVALAALAWQLWQRHGEHTHPALAARRLGDLDGRVSYEPDRVTVWMPLGRRHADLRDSGLLRTVASVPWMDGRRLELLGG